MDFTALHQGAIALAATIATVINLTFAPVNPPIVDPNLRYPERISSYLTDLSASGENDIKLQLVAKEPNPAGESLVTVEQPPVIYTVEEPPPADEPKPSISPAIKIEALKESKVPEAEARESKTEETAPTPEPSLKPAAASGSSNADKLFQMVNEHRSKLGKRAFEKDDRLCKIAEGRAPQVDGELSAGSLHKGFKALNLPYWATENIAAYNTIEEDFKFWIADYIHRIAIEGDHKYSCVACACAGASCSQIFSSFVLR